MNLHLAIKMMTERMLALKLFYHGTKHVINIFSIPSERGGCKRVRLCKIIVVRSRSPHSPHSEPLIWHSMMPKESDSIIYTNLYKSIDGRSERTWPTCEPWLDSDGRSESSNDKSINWEYNNNRQSFKLMCTANICVINHKWPLAAIYFPLGQTRWLLFLFARAKHSAIGRGFWWNCAAH